MDADNLYIARVDIGRAFALKRFATRGRGKSSRILKTFSNIKVYLAEKSVEEPVKKATKNQKKGE
jgi:large subunit ribosomal protein L22